MRTAAVGITESPVIHDARLPLLWALTHHAWDTTSESPTPRTTLLLKCNACLQPSMQCGIAANPTDKSLLCRVYVPFTQTDYSIK